MAMLSRAGTLWLRDDGSLYEGNVTLIHPLPAGTTFKVQVWPQAARRGKPKLDLYLEEILSIPTPPPPPDDFIWPGEVMHQYFKAPRASHRRHKILVWGPSGSGKTTLALQFPSCAYIDNHGSAEKYEAAYPEHLFAHPHGPDDAMAAVTSLLKDPAKRRTLVIDDLTTYWGQVQEKWADLFLKRLPRSKGHHAEFYSFQPSDWIHPKRELKSLIQRAIALDMNVVAIARAQKEYAGEGDSFMKVIGETFAGEKNLPHEFDYIFELRREGDQRVAVVHKQRVSPGQKPLPEKFQFVIDDQGRSDFVAIISLYGNPDDLNRDPAQVDDPVMPEALPEAQPETTPELPAPLGPEVLAPATMPPDPPGGFSSILDEQIARLQEMKAYLKIDNAEWGRTLMKLYNVTTARVLNTAQGAHLINYLETKRVPF